MLSRKNRFQVRSEKDFFKNCQIINFKLIKCYFLPTQEEIRIAVRVTKNTAKTAVKRHKIKRKISDFFEKKIKVETGFGKLLIITKTNLGNFNWSEVIKDLEQVWLSINENKKTDQKYTKIVSN